MKTVWLLQIGEPIPVDNTIRKMRTAILADMLSEKGYKVVWWASAFSHQKREMLFEGEKEFRLKNNLIVYPLKGITYSKNISLRRYVNLRVIASKFRKIAREKDKPDIIITSLPCHLLSYEAVRYAKNNRVPIIVDVRDKWPDTLIDVFNSKIIRLVLKILLVQDIRRCIYALNNSDMVISVSREFLSWAIDKLRSKSKKTDVLYLGYKMDEKDNITECPNWLIKYKNKRIIFYVGTFGKSYQLELVIQAANNIENEIKNEIKNEKNKCFDSLKKNFESLGYVVTLKKGETKVELLPKRISVSFGNNLTLTKDNSERYNKLSVIVNNNLYELVSITNSILNMEARYGDSETTIYMNYYHNLKVEKKKQIDGTTIYILTDRNKGDKFQFASRSIAWPPGI